MAPSIRSVHTGYRPPPSAFKGPPSPTLSATTRASQLDLGEEGPKVIVTRADLRKSVAAYEQLLSSAKGYRNALIALSSASTALAGALGECARVKGSGDSGEQLMAASGLHYIVANSGRILSDTLYRSFEVPLMHSYDSYVAEIAARHAEYETLLAEKTKAIRETEAENMRQGRKKNRDLNQFRIALSKLTEQVAEVEVCKRSYYSEVLENETELWSMIGGKVSLLVRSTLDLADRLASKATSDPVIESMLNEHPDPFDSYRPESEEERDVFTILPPINLSIAGSSNASPVLGKKANGNGMNGTTSVMASATGDADGGKETKERGQERERQDANLTPRQASKAPVSVSQVLGLDQVTDEEEEEPLPRTPRGREPSQDGPARSVKSPNAALHSRAPSGHLPLSPSSAINTDDPACRTHSHALPPTITTTISSPTSPVTPSATSTPSTTVDNSPSLTPALTTDSYDPPSLTTESAPFAALSRPSTSASDTLLASPTASTASLPPPPPSTTAPTARSPTKSKNHSRRSRGLSRVSEATDSASSVPGEEVDEMAGDWGAPVYGRQLSPAMHGGGGYDSAEEEGDEGRGPWTR
ncbi:hypothetical protein JCM11251_002470 [Rhodosporidiobolus azoricus]